MSSFGCLIINWFDFSYIVIENFYGCLSWCFVARPQRKIGKILLEGFLPIFSDACFLDGVNVRSHSISIVFRGEGTESFGGAKVPTIFLEIGKITSLSTPNISRSNYHSALQKILSTPNIFHFPPPLVSDIAITINAFWFWKHKFLHISFQNCWKENNFSFYKYCARAIMGYFSYFVSAPLSNLAKTEFLCVFYVLTCRPA